MTLKKLFFHKNLFKEEIPLKIPALMIKNKNIERKYLQIYSEKLEEYISWNKHVRADENRVAKDIGLTIL